MNRLRETKNTELKVKPEDFYAHLNIKHWSGCWGGTIIQEAVPDLRKYLEKLSTEAKWISEFLKNSEPTQLRLERVVGTENGRHEKLAGQEYILKARLQNPERDLTCHWYARIHSFNFWQRIISRIQVRTRKA